MFEITNDMKKMRAEKIANIEKRIDKNIERAVKGGYLHCHFPCSKDTDKDVYDEIRNKYEKAGYTIKPTGYIGGVWQTTEDICW